MPNTAGLGAGHSGYPKLMSAVLLVVHDHCHTNLPNIWAIGDVVRGPMLAHKAVKKVLQLLSASQGKNHTLIST